MKTIDNRDFTLTETLDRLAVETVDRVGDLGVDGVEVAISSGNGLSVTVRGGACETVEHQRDKSLAITVYDGGRKGTATSSDFSAQALADSIAAAKRIADYAESDPCAGLAEPEFLAGEIPELELDHPWEIDAEAAVVKALECERAALGFDQRIKQSDGCSVNRYRGARAYANSHGFHGVYRGTRHSMSAI
ncbi:MAG: DNA gyrase modulator, partial [Gammaproteobacteria bacterium]